MADTRPQSEEMFRLLVHSVTDYGIIVLDAEGRVQHAQRLAAEEAAHAEAARRGQELEVALRASILAYSRAGRVSKPEPQLGQLVRLVDDMYRSQRL
jgi:hypothetical protein